MSDINERSPLKQHPPFSLGTALEFGTSGNSNSNNRGVHDVGLPPRTSEARASSIISNVSGNAAAAAAQAVTGSSSSLLAQPEEAPVVPLVASAVATQSSIDQDATIDANSYGGFVRPPLGNFIRPCDCCCCCSSSCRCCSTCVAVPDVYGTQVTVIASIVAATVGFCVFTVPADEIWSKAIVAVIAAADIAVLLRLSCCDPGIILPARVGEPPQQPRTVTIDGVGDVKLEVCESCRITRPVRSGHAQRADACLAEFDHHCGIVQAAVAVRNWRFFYFFIFFTDLLCLFIFVRGVVVAAQFDYGQATSDSMLTAQIAVTYVLLFFALSVGWGIAIILVQYTGFACRGLTLKDVRGRKTMVPADQAATCGRYCERLFGPIPASALEQLFVSQRQQQEQATAAERYAI